MAQLLLIPNARPLEERLGAEFFRRAAHRPGVYLMKDETGRVIYVGKAKDLKQRLGYYRVANPERMPRRQLRLVREVAKVEFEFCASEKAALRREAKLLLALKPRFNRAGVRPGKTRFMVWRRMEENLELGVVEVPEANWRRMGPLGSGALMVHGALCRLLWLAVNVHASLLERPGGWMQNRQAEVQRICCRGQTAEVLSGVEKFLWENSDGLLHWLDAQFGGRTHPFEQAAIQFERDALVGFWESRKNRKGVDRQLNLL